MAVKSPASPDDIEMSSILGALKQSWKKLFLTSAVLAALTYGGLSMIAPKYQSEAELQIDARGSANAFPDPKATPASPDTITTKMDKEAINTHVKALKSADLLSKLAETMSLKDKPEFNSEIGPIDGLDSMMRLVGIGGPRGGESEHDRVLNTLRNQLEVYTAKESRFIGEAAKIQSQPAILDAADDRSG